MPSAFGKPVTTANRFGVVTATVAQSMTLVTTLTASSSASLSYTSFASASYKSYRLMFSRIIPASNDVDLRVQASVDGGANYGALWSYGTGVFDNSNTWGSNPGNAQTNNMLIYNTSNAASATYSGVID